MKHVVLILSLAGVIFGNAAGQSIDSIRVRQRPLLQLGSFLYGQNGFVVHAEMERPFRRAPFLTHGPRVEYARLNSQNDNSVYAGFQLKFYATYWADPVPYRGLYIGIEPLAVITTDKSNEVTRYGPGLASMFGYQYVFQNHSLSLGVETNLMYCYNMRKGEPSDIHGQGMFLNSFIIVKIGFRV